MVRLDLAVPLVVRCRWPYGVSVALAWGIVAACAQLDVEADEAFGGGVADDDGVVPSPVGCQRRHQALTGAFGSAWGSEQEVQGERVPPGFDQGLAAAGLTTRVAAPVRRSARGTLPRR